MAREIALDSIHLRPTPRPGHTEYSLEYHTEYIRRVTGLDPTDPRFLAAFYDSWDIDFLWSTNDGLHGAWGERGRATDMGHAEYASDGSDMRASASSPFKSVDEVLAFDAIAEYGLPDLAEQTRAYEAWWQATQASSPNQLVTGGYYKSIISGAIEAFGWDLLLEAAAQPARMERVLDTIFRFTHRHMEAWAGTSAEVIIQHDDFVWTAGPFIKPAFYRSVIIPRYAELWKPLHAAGKKVVFCSDGNFTMFAEDVVAAGADALCFEPCNPWDLMAERFGDSIALIGSAVDCRTMTFSTREEVDAAIEQTLRAARSCRGVIVAVGNHLPANVPDEMLDHYLGAYQAQWCGANRH